MMLDPESWPAPDLLSRRAAETPERAALVAAETGESWTYRELAAGPVAELAAGLRDHGLVPGDHVGILAPPGMTVARLHHAAGRAGLVFVPLPPGAPAAVVQQRASAAAIDALVVGGQQAEAASGFAGPVVEQRSLASDADPPTPYEWTSDDCRWLVFTSGTTGEPQPVQLTAGNLLASAAASAKRLGVEPDDRWLACLPMHHVGGLAPLVRSALYGTTAVVQAGFDAEVTAEVIDERSVTGVSLVPTMLTRLLEQGWRPSDSLRFVLLGGAPASVELIDRCEEAGVPVHPTYGATETASQVATATPTEAFAHPGTVGTPLDGVEVQVQDDAGESLAPGEVGELVVSGRVVSPGYFGADADSGTRFVGGAFHTRDRGYRDEADRLWVLGRVDDAIHTGGVTVHPEPIEACLRRAGGVSEAVVVGLEDPEWGEIVAALVTSSSGATPTEQALIEHCREQLDAPSVPKLVAVADELPRTASGTVDRRRARELLTAGRRDGV